MPDRPDAPIAYRPEAAPAAAAAPSAGTPPRIPDTEAGLAVRLRAVRERIAAAERAASRPEGSVALLAVSKTFGADAVAAAAGCGQRAFGENYVQEAIDKIATLAGNAGEGDRGLEWHFIGPLQSNKTRPVAESFDWVHSVDRERVARRLAEQRPAARGPLQVCVQVNVSGEDSKSGCAPDEAPALARAIVAMPALRLRGVMAIPEPTDDPAAQRAAFGRVRQAFDAIRAALAADALADPDGPAARALPGIDTLSMGMSADLEAAIAEGATVVRVGTAIFGARDYAR